jgi:hypothetical protein
VSHGFSIINVCNPGAHYETPCIAFNDNIYPNFSKDEKYYRQSYRDNQNTRFMLNNGVGTATQATDKKYNTAHAHCLLGNQG